MRAVVLRDAGRLAVEDWPEPTAGSGDLVVRLRGCGLCGSDIAKIVPSPPRVPIVLGHELVGDVVAVGPGAEGFAPGDRVVAAHHVPCGRCHYCCRGSHSMCREFKRSNLDPGGFAEYVRVPEPNVRHATFRVPEDISDEVASFVEPVACCVRAMRRAPVATDDTVVIVGLGSIGCLFVQLAKRAGAHVIGIDPLGERAALAKRLGADDAGPGADGVDGAGARRITEVIAARSDGRGADQVIVTGGGADVLPSAAACVRDGGTIHYFAGGGGDRLPLPLAELYHRELTIVSTYSSSPADLAEAFRLVTREEIVVAPLITDRVPLEGVATGVERMRRRQALKVFVTP
jgi:L-iditol 2-dehydrogenase